MGLSDDVHALSYRLHPSMLDDLGLREALRAECELFSRRESIPTELKSADLPSEIPPDVALCLFRIAQEALHNTARHALASHVTLSLERKNGGVRMVVSDDGIGFDPTRGPRRPTLGQESMRERAHLVDGTLVIESSPGHGTTVVAWVPVQTGAP
jgi:signal transduction histidine kinase